MTRPSVGCATIVLYPTLYAVIAVAQNRPAASSCTDEFSRQVVSQLAAGREPDDGLGALSVRAGSGAALFEGIHPHGRGALVENR